MSALKPEFRLGSILSDGSETEPQIVPVGAIPWGTGMPRRGALGTALGLGSVLALLPAQGGSAKKTDETRHPFACETTGELKAHLRSVTAMAATPDGKMLLSGDTEEALKLWALPGGKLLHRIVRPGGIRALALAPDGKTAAVGEGDGAISFWALPSGDVIPGFLKPATLARARNVAVNCLAVSPDGKLLAAGYSDKTIRVWSMAERRLLDTLGGHSGSVTALAISPDGATLASGSVDRSIRLWSLPNGKFLKKVKGHGGTVFSLAFNNTGDKFLSGSADKTVRIWALPRGSLFHRIKFHGAVKAVTFARDGKFIAMGGFDRAVYWASMDDLAHVDPVFSGHKSPITCVTSVPSENLLASSDSGGTIILWNLDSYDKSQCSQSYLFAPDATPQHVRGSAYNVYDKVTGQTTTYTMPCGSPIPRGATCTCNCVPGTYSVPVPAPSTGGGYRTYGGGTYCSCNKVCTCVPVMVPSSARWKENAAPIEDALQRVTQLQGVRFDWKIDAPIDRRGSDLGFIAEDLWEIVPEVVARDPSGQPCAVDYARLTVLLAEAIKAQQLKILELQAQIAEIRGCGAANGTAC